MPWSARTLVRTFVGYYEKYSSYLFYYKEPQKQMWIAAAGPRLPRKAAGGGSQVPRDRRGSGCCRRVGRATRVPPYGLTDPPRDVPVLNCSYAAAVFGPLLSDNMSR